MINKYNIMKLWIARDKDRTLTLFQGKPQLSKYDPIWQELYNEDSMTIDPFLFPEVTFENSPQRVEVELAESNSGKELLYVAQKTAERTKKELKIKAREWLNENKDNYIIDIEGETIVDDAIIKDLLKALEEE